MKDSFDSLISGEQPYMLVGRDELPADTVLLSGSFNPLHRGHEELLRAAEQISGRTGMFELSVFNVDKPALDQAEVERRLRNVKGSYAVVLTCAPTFAEKAERLPGAWFALGYDTAVRLLSPDYHADITAMLTRFRALNTRFVIAGRTCEGAFLGLDQLDIPAGFADLFVPVPERIFREDISSTEIRRRM